MNNRKGRQHAMTADLKGEQRRVVFNSILAAALCAAMLAGGYLLLPRLLDFPTDMTGRLVFALRADLFVLFWVLIGVRLVSRGRFRSAADIGGSAYAPPSPAIAVQAAFLQNTLEQAIIAVGAHLALATLVVAVMLFAFGRLTFLIGYPKGAGARAFGMVTTSLPSFLGYGLAAVLLLLRLSP
jgi:hypothetical protein